MKKNKVDALKLILPPAWHGMIVKVEKYHDCDNPKKIISEHVTLRTETGGLISGSWDIVCAIAHAAFSEKAKHLEEDCYVDVNQVNIKATDDMFEELREAKENADAWLAAASE